MFLADVDSVCLLLGFEDYKRARAAHAGDGVKNKLNENQGLDCATSKTSREIIFCISGFL
jgi:hypothetical protein